MKKSAVAWAAALALALALTGCSADQPANSAGMNDGRGPAGTSADPNRGGAGTGSSDSMDNPTPSIRPTPDVNDAEDGGGAGGTNDVDNDGMPETDVQARAYDRTHGGIDDEGRVVDNGGNGTNNGSANNGSANNGSANNGGNGNGGNANNAGGTNSGAGIIMDDVGRAAGDAVQGAGNAIRDAGNAIGDAVTGR